MAINWEDAPADAEIHIKYLRQAGDEGWWIKLDGDKYFWCRGGHHVRWRGPSEGYAEMIVRERYIVTHRPKEAVNMYKAKDIKHTQAYQQLRRCIELSVEDVGKRPYELGQLTKRFLQRLSEQRDRPIGLEEHWDVCDLLTWVDTAEGHAYWERIHSGVRVINLKPCPIVEGGKKAKAKPAKLPPKAPAVLKRLGWWHV